MQYLACRSNDRFGPSLLLQQGQKKLTPRRTEVFNEPIFTDAATRTNVRY